MHTGADIGHQQKLLDADIVHFKRQGVTGDFDEQAVQLFPQLRLLGLLRRREGAGGGGPCDLLERAAVRLAARPGADA